MMKKQTLMQLVGAAAIVALALAQNILSANGVIDDELSTRAMGVILAVVFILLGNTMPKKLKPLSDNQCGHARGQSLRRFAGWSFVLTGLACLVVWLATPVKFAGIATLILMAACVLLVKATCVRSRMARKRAEPLA